MIVYVNNNNEIKDVETTTDEGLVPVEIADEDNLFKRTIAEICCYKVVIKEGRYVGFVPYVDTKIIEHIARLGKKNAQLEEQDAVLSSTVDSILTDIIPSLMGE